MSFDRQEKALREFKQILEDLVHLLRHSCNSELAYLTWVNKEREQFVWETNSTNLPNVMFQDRVAFENHFLNDFKETDEIRMLKVGEDISPGKLMHYFDFVQAKYILIIPFINKGETVALTILESEKEPDLQKVHDRIAAYNNAIVNVLATYLEVADQYESQTGWEDYEHSLAKFDFRMHRVDLLSLMLNEMQKMLIGGGAVLLCPGMDTWNVVLKSKQAVSSPELGMLLQEKSVAYEALEAGKPHFTMHFNNNPRRISTSELFTEGATFAIPIMIHDRRQGVVVCYDKDPLVFKESVKHKLSNLARTASLCIQSSAKRKGLTEDLMTQDFGAFMPELWEKALETEVSLLKAGKGTPLWFGLVTPDDISALRTKYRLEDLKRMQQDFVTFLNPSRYGITGYIGYNSDYVYSFIIQSKKENAVYDWMESVSQKSEQGIKLFNGTMIHNQFLAGYTKVTGEESNTYQIIEKAKKALSNAMNQEKLIMEG